MQADEIIAKLEKPVHDRRPLVRKIIAVEDLSQVIAALTSHPSSSLVRQILCDILGYKADKQAMPILITALQDPAEGVRSSAADALAKIKDGAAGLPLFEQYQREAATSSVRSMILAALGAVGYMPAIPTLIFALDSSDSAMRLCAAWSLGALRTQDAQDALQRVLAKEPPGSSAAAAIQEALKQIAASHP